MILNVVVPVYARGDDKEEALEHLAELCRNNGNRDMLEGWHECPVKGINDKNSLLDCPFKEEKFQYCTEIEAKDWEAVLAENYLR